MKILTHKLQDKRGLLDSPLNQELDGSKLSKKLSLFWHLIKNLQLQYIKPIENITIYHIETKIYEDEINYR
jgi:hypothetical protein